MPNEVTAFAPATVANVGIGFDILGHTIEASAIGFGAERIDAREVRIRAVKGVAGELPVDPKSNTAGRALQAMQAALKLEHRIRD